ncbi:MAG: LemA family protein [Candidatus Gottesmanbacteria bacterium GW2011_GWC2_39_8]|uniref:LemA family protein n=1 Tax=Candidatus Gottesmanbacteria bacterium GW2011_GWC2_39_8 TaxID=1618450 RepID=A0A0G0Q280_9BACT|nr:MAG: LemA family protein [Candidatus Gottesmanbacteria bacterium GW2011_GWC2_39_8]
MNPFLIAGVLILILVVFIWSLYNGLVTSKMRVKEAWSGIDVQLKRRTDLIPNLIETVKGYAKHEKEVFENVTKARAALMSAGGPHDKAKAEGELTGALKSLFAVAEAYPELKASENFVQLQKELGDTEDKIAYARQFYNTSVLDYNTRIKVFPAVLFAGSLGFTDEEFYEAEEGERKKVEVKFS